MGIAGVANLRGGGREQDKRHASGRSDADNSREVRTGPKRSSKEHREECADQGQSRHKHEEH